MILNYLYLFDFLSTPWIRLKEEVSNVSHSELQRDHIVRELYIVHCEQSG